MESTAEVSVGRPLGRTLFIPVIAPRGTALQMPLHAAGGAIARIIFVVRRSHALRCTAPARAEAVVVAGGDAGYGDSFTAFKRIAYRFMVELDDADPNGRSDARIGVVGASSELLGYFLAKWMVEEEEFGVVDGIECVQSAVGFVFSKDKYAEWLARSYGGSRSFGAVRHYENAELLEPKESGAHIGSAGSGCVLRMEDVADIAKRADMMDKLSKLSLRVLRSVTGDSLRAIAKCKDRYCVFPLFCGERAAIYVGGGSCVVMLGNNALKEVRVEFKSPVCALLEGLVFDAVVQLNDIFSLNNQKTDDLKFNQRITLIYRYLIQNQVSGNPVRFEVTPFYKVSDFKQLTEKKIQNIKGWCFTETEQNNNTYYSWNLKNENPIAVLHLNFSQNCAFAQFTDSLKLIDIVSLGKITPELFELNGNLIEITITESSKNKIQGKIVRKSTQLSPWSITKFNETYSQENVIRIEDIINACS